MVQQGNDQQFPESALVLSEMEQIKDNKVDILSKANEFEELTD